MISKPRFVLPKVNIVTFYRLPHPGAVLQAFALSEAVKKLGGAPEMVAYSPSFGRAAKFSLKRIVRDVLGISSAWGYASYRAVSLNETARVYKACDELDKDPPPGDVLICGSDQIWNANMFPSRELDPVYFLQFGRADIRRVSYAASFGGWAPDSHSLRQIKGFLHAFHSISIREPAQKSAVENVLKRKIEVTLDPTLLISDHEILSLPRKRKSEEYILAYGVQRSDHFFRVVARASKFFGCRVIELNGPMDPRKRVGRRVICNSPLDWLSLINSARAVVTNSFHGVALSLLSDVPVFYPPLMGDMADRNERIFNLCDICGVYKRIVVADDPKGFVTPCFDRDWDCERFRAAQEHSIGFLKNAVFQNGDGA